jgi:hypothetical protein
MTPSYSLAWDETSVAYEEVISSEGWLTGQIDIPSINLIVHEASILSLYVLSALNSRTSSSVSAHDDFGVRLRYSVGISIIGFESHPETLVTVIKIFVLLAVMPRWMLRLPFKVRTLVKT